MSCLYIENRNRISGIQYVVLRLRQLKSLCFTLHFLIFFVFHISAQKNDYIWPMGYNPLDPDTTKWTEEYLRQWGYYNLEFFDDYPKMVRDYDRVLGIYSTVAAYSDDNGKLLYTTNGQRVIDIGKKFGLLGVFIGANDKWYWDLFKGTGYNDVQAALMLPWPGRDSVAVFVSLYKEETRRTYLVSMTTIDNNKKEVVDIDRPKREGNYKSGSLQACRHANGRDWWMIKPHYDGAGYDIYLFDIDGVRLDKEQFFGDTLSGLDIGQAAFSLKGDKYGYIEDFYWDSITQVKLFDFDRCTGTLSNFRIDTIENYEGSLGAGVGFSNDSKIFYASNRYNLYQYDAESSDFVNSKEIIAEYDGFINHPTWTVETAFGGFAPGPDGRLYNFMPASGGLWLHSIDFPDEHGSNCIVRQHAIPIPYQSRTIPNFPNYRLGPLDGSACDTLDIDNHPIAKYRYEPDTIDYRRIRFTDLSYFRPETWSWDYGDGSPLVSQKHNYHTFPADGTYRVCLTVSNENSSNTACRDITIGVSSTDDDENIHPIDVHLFPNPVEDVLLITIGEYVPADAYVEFYSTLGQQVHRQKAYYGHNNIDLSGLPSGVYTWRIVDRGDEIKSGKITKM
jgi:hypothetical protein